MSIAKSLTYYLGFKRGPKPGARDRVNRDLQARTALSSHDCFVRFWKPLGGDRDVSSFVYEKLQDYSGVQFSKVVPKDRFREDLRFCDVCWNGWEFDFAEDFGDRFGTSVSELLSDDLETVDTVQQLVLLCDGMVKKQRQRD